MGTKILEFRLSIRDFGAEDAQRIHEIAAKAWRFTYKALYDPEYIEQFVATRYSIKGLRGQLKPMEESLCHFRVIGEPVTGFLQMGYPGFWDRKTMDTNSVEILRLYIDPDLIGRGYGKALLQDAERLVREVYQMKNIGLYLHSLNELGKSFYLRNNFIPVPIRDVMNREGLEWFLQKHL